VDIELPVVSDKQNLGMFVMIDVNGSRRDCDQVKDKNPIGG